MSTRSFLILLLLTTGFLPAGAGGEASRPRLLLTSDKLPELREQVLKPGWKRDIYLKTVRANADRWVDREIRIPAKGGWVQDLVCSDGTTLAIPADQDFGTTTSYACPACGKSYSGARFDAARRRLEHEWLMAAARDLAFAGVIEQNTRFLDKSAEILLGYADARFPGHGSPQGGGIFKQSLNDAVAIITLAQAYDLVASTDTLSRQERERVERDVFRESAEGLTRCSLRANWGSWHLSAVGVIGLATSHERYIQYADQAFRMQMETEVGSDGLWPESVHGYHFYALRAFIEYAEAAANSGTDLYSYEARPGQGLRAMFEAPLSFMYPNLELPALNDGFLSQSMPFEQYEVAWARYRDPRFAWLLKQRRRTDVKRPRGSQTPSAIWTLIHGDPLPRHVEAPPLESVDFSNIGTCVLRNSSSLPQAEQVMVTFDYGRMLSHGQLDKMGVTLFGAGRILAADYGTPAYGSAISPFYRSPLAHNTLMLAGAQQAATSRNGLVFFQARPGLKAACAQSTEALPGTSWRRTVILDDETSEPHVLVVDELQSTAPQPFRWCFHSEGDHFSLATPPDVKRTVAEADYPFLTSLNSHSPTAQAIQATWSFRDGSGLELLSAPGTSTEVVTAAFPAETAARRVPGIILSRDSAQTTYVVVLKPRRSSPSGRPPQLRVSENGAIVLSANGTDRVYRITPTGVTRE